MASFIDERPASSNGEVSAEEIATIEELAKEMQKPAPQVTSAPPEVEDIPEKYRGKSLKDIVRMHQEAEKAMGRQSSEVGELRKVVDEFISKQTELVAKKEPVEEVDFFADPNKAVSHAIESHPAVAELKSYKEQSRKAAAQAEVMRRHPDVNDIIADPEFLEWVMKTPVRQKLLVQADKEYDIEAADELFTTYKERKQLVSQTVNTEKAARKEATKQASTGSTQVAETPVSKKKFRRADIIKLMQDDPKRYEMLAPEIRQAYAEGRVI